MNKNIIFQEVQKIIDIIFFSSYVKTVLRFYGILCSSIYGISIFHVMEFIDMGKA